MIWLLICDLLSITPFERADLLFCCFAVLLLSPLRRLTLLQPHSPCTNHLALSTSR